MKIGRLALSIGGILMMACSALFAGSSPDSISGTTEFAGRTVNVELHRHSIRSSDFFVNVWRHTEGRPELEGTFEIAEVDQARTYRGSVVEFPNMTVLGLWKEGGEVECVFIEGFNMWDKITMKPAKAPASRTLEATASVAPNFRPAERYIVKESRKREGFIPAPMDRPLRSLRFVLEAEHRFLKDLTTQQAVDQMEWKMYLTDMIYARDTLATHELTGIILRRDPFITSGVGKYWVQVQQDREMNTGYPVFDNAHLIRGFGGGVAGLGGMNINKAVGSQSSNSLYYITHELAHNWGVGHGSDPEVTTSPYPNPTMSGQGTWLGPGAQFKVFRTTDRMAHGMKVIEEYPAVPPYPAADIVELDASQLTQEGGILIDVLLNDHDGNGDWIKLASCSALTAAQGRAEVARGSGPDGRDQIRYFPPKGYSGKDKITYKLLDESGLSNTGIVLINRTAVADKSLKPNEALFADAVRYLPLDSSYTDYTANYAGGAPSLARKTVGAGYVESVEGFIGGGVRAYPNAVLLMRNFAKADPEATPTGWTLSFMAQLQSDDELVPFVGSAARGWPALIHLDKGELVLPPKKRAAPVSLGASLSVGKWTHVVISRKGTKMTVYLNGDKQGSATNDRSVDGFTLSGDVVFDEVASWNRVLTEAEIKQLSKRLAARKPLINLNQ